MGGYIPIFASSQIACLGGRVPSDLLNSLTGQAESIPKPLSGKATQELAQKSSAVVFSVRA
jgi:hypothetical protein